MAESFESSLLSSIYEPNQLEISHHDAPLDSIRKRLQEAKKLLNLNTSTSKEGLSPAHKQHESSSSTIVDMFILGKDIALVLEEYKERQRLQEDKVARANIVSEVSAALASFLASTQKSPASSVPDHDGLSRTLVELTDLVRRYASHLDTQHHPAVSLAVLGLAQDFSCDLHHEIHQLRNKVDELNASVESLTIERDGKASEALTLSSLLMHERHLHLEVVEGFKANTHRQVATDSNLSDDVASAKLRVLLLESELRDKSEAARAASLRCTKQLSVCKLRLQDAHDKYLHLLSLSKTTHAEGAAAVELAKKLKLKNVRLKHKLYVLDEAFSDFSVVNSDLYAERQKTAVLQTEVSKLNDLLTVRMHAYSELEDMVSVLKEQLKISEAEKEGLWSRLASILEEKQRTDQESIAAMQSLRGITRRHQSTFRSYMSSLNNVMVSCLMHGRDSSGVSIQGSVANFGGNKCIEFDHIFEMPRQSDSCSAPIEFDCGVDALVHLAFTGRRVALISYGHSSSDKSSAMFQGSQSVLGQVFRAVSNECKELFPSSTEVMIGFGAFAVLGESLVDLFQADAELKAVKTDEFVTIQGLATTVIESAVDAERICEALHTKRQCGGIEAAQSMHIVSFLRVFIDGHDEAGNQTSQSVLIAVVDLASCDKGDSVLQSHSVSDLRAAQKLSRSFKSLADALQSMSVGNIAGAASSSMLTYVLQDFLAEEGAVHLLVSVSAATHHLADSLLTAEYARACRRPNYGMGEDKLLRRSPKKVNVVNYNDHRLKFPYL